MKKMSRLDMISAVSTRVSNLMYEFRSEFGMSNFDCGDPELFFDLKGTTSGQSCFFYNENKGYIRFNRILMEENWDDFDRTIVHEVAHHCVSLAYGLLRTRNGRRVIHGKEWKRMMIFFGIDPKRCHSYDVSNCRAKKKMTTYDYMCDCQFFKLSKVRHNKILRGKKYFCNTCNGDLIPV